jgi:hypothetical protein
MTRAQALQQLSVDRDIRGGRHKQKVYAWPRRSYLVRCGDDDLLVVILGDSQEAIDQMRAEIGDDWMPANIVPHAASPPDRLVGEIVAAFDRT